MTAATSCPHCGAAGLELDPAAGPRPLVDCPACDRSFIARAEGAPPPALPTTDASSPGPLAHRHPTDVSLLTSGAGGAVATLALYAGVLPLLEGNLIGSLLGERGWVPVAISFLALWSVVLLARKAWLLRQQRAGRALLEGVLAGEGPIDAQSADELAVRVEQLAGRYPRSLWLERIQSALAHFAGRREVSAVVEHRALAAQADAQAVDASYAIVRVFIWAIPILGFIGTVIGIGAAVAGFSDSVASAVDLEVMKQSIGTVTSGLGVAFDTTLLALVVSLLLMLPTSVLQKAEEDWLAELDALCDERLVQRMRNAAGASQAPDATLAELSKEISRLASAIDRLAPPS